MKIAIITSYWKNSGGGVETYLTNLVDELNKRNGLEITVLYREGIDIHNYHISGNKLSFILKSLFQLKKIRPQVVHSQGTWYCLMAGYLYKIIYGGRLIHTFHSEPEKRLFCIGKIFLQKMINMCDSVTFVSKGLKDSIIEFYGLRFQTSDITYSGVKEKVPSKEAMNSFYSQYGINANSIILLIQAFTSYNLKKKGVIYVLDAMKELIPKYPNMVLILTKEGLYSNELRDYSNSIGISKNIIFTGNVSNPFVPLEICDIFVFPWLGKSGIGIALIEAMIMGKPIIATSLNGYGVSEVLDDGINGFLVEPSAELIATKIEYLIQNPEFAKEMGCRAKVDADKKFTWGKTADLFYNIYNCG